MSNYLELQNTLSGAEARGFLTIHNRVHEMFYAKKLEASAEKTKKEGKTIGFRGTQSKATGWKGTGSMTIYYVTSLFRQMMIEYIKTGVDTYFDLQIVNEDPTSSVGKQTIVIKNVNLNKVVLAKFDLESDILDEEIDFTFDDVEILNAFQDPQS